MAVLEEHSNPACALLSLLEDLAGERLLAGEE
jgi:hypothetical protein